MQEGGPPLPPRRRRAPSKNHNTRLRLGGRDGGAISKEATQTLIFTVGLGILNYSSIVSPSQSLEYSLGLLQGNNNDYIKKIIY